MNTTLNTETTLNTTRILEKSEIISSPTPLQSSEPIPLHHRRPPARNLKPRSHNNNNNNNNQGGPQQRVRGEPPTPREQLAINEAERQARFWQAQGEYAWAVSWDGYARAVRMTATHDQDRLQAPCNPSQTSYRWGLKPIR